MNQREEVLAYIGSLGPGATVTGNEVNRHFHDLAMGQDPPDVRKALSRPHARLNDLQRRGDLVYAAKRICTVSGMLCRTYRLRGEHDAPLEPRRRTNGKPKDPRDALREFADRFMDEQLVTVDPDEAARLRKLAKAEMTRFFQYIQAMVVTAERKTERDKAVDEATAATLDRQDYDRALAFFGHRVKRGEFAKDRDWLPIYRDKIRSFHPDRNGGADNPTFTRTTEAYHIIRNYHDKYHNPKKVEGGKAC